MRADLVAAAAKRGRRSLSGEIAARLRATLDRDRAEFGRPRHIQGLGETVERIALALEGRTKLAWVEDRYTQQQLSKAIDLLLYSYSRGEAAVPPSVAKEAEDRAPPEAREHYIAQLGEAVAGGIMALLKVPPEPWEGSWQLPDGRWARYPDDWRALWAIEQDLKLRRRHK
jgi:hypothetical protein